MVLGFSGVCFVFLFSKSSSAKGMVKAQVNLGLNKLQGSLRGAPTEARLQSHGTLQELTGLMEDGIGASATHPGLHA